MLRSSVCSCTPHRWVSSWCWSQYMCIDVITSEWVLDVEASTDVLMWSQVSEFLMLKPVQVYWCDHRWVSSWGSCPYRWSHVHISVNNLAETMLTLFRSPCLTHTSSHRSSSSSTLCMISLTCDHINTCESPVWYHLKWVQASYHRYNHCHQQQCQVLQKSRLVHLCLASNLHIKKHRNELYYIISYRLHYTAQLHISTLCWDHVLCVTCWLCLFCVCYSLCPWDRAVHSIADTRLHPALVHAHVVEMYSVAF